MDTHIWRNYSKKWKIFWSNSHWLCCREKRWRSCWLSFTTCLVIIMLLNFESKLALCIGSKNNFLKQKHF